MCLCLYCSRGVCCVYVVVCFVLFPIVVYVVAASLGRGVGGGWCWPTAILAAFVHLFLYVIPYDYIHRNLS